MGDAHSGGRSSPESMWLYRETKNICNHSRSISRNNLETAKAADRNIRLYSLTGDFPHSHQA